MLEIGYSNRHALPRINLFENASTTARAPLLRAGSFFDPKQLFAFIATNAGLCPFAGID
jgi:hypothetical protein